MFDERITEYLIAYQDALNEEDATQALPDETALPDRSRDQLRKSKQCLERLVAFRQQLLSAPGVSRPEAGSNVRRIGRFELREQIGVGGFGIVYRAWDPLTRRDVALKIPRVEALASVELQQRFEQEARAAARLDHPGIVQVLEAGFDGLLPYIA